MWCLSCTFENIRAPEKRMLVKLIDGDIGGLGEQYNIMTVRTTGGLALALAVIALFPMAIVAEAPSTFPLVYASSILFHAEIGSVSR